MERRRLFASHTDKLNSLQVLLVDRSDGGVANFDILFNYGNIRWETGDASGGANGLGGTSAAVGFNAGTGNADGTFHHAPGSLVNGALIDGGPNALTNQHVAFQVRAGTPMVVPPVTGAVPEPATWAMMLVGVGAVGFAMRRPQRCASATPPDRSRLSLLRLNGRNAPPRRGTNG